MVVLQGNGWSVGKDAADTFRDEITPFFAAITGGVVAFSPSSAPRSFSLSSVQSSRSWPIRLSLVVLPLAPLFLVSEFCFFLRRRRAFPPILAEANADPGPAVGMVGSCTRGIVSVFCSPRANLYNEVHAGVRSVDFPPFTTDVIRSWCT